MTRQQITGFIVGLLAVSWSAQYVILRFAGGIDAPAAAPLMVGVMFLPGLFGLAFVVLSKPVRSSVQWKPRGVAAILVSMVLPLILAMSAIAIITLAGIGRSEYFAFAPGFVEILSGPWTLGTGQQPWLLFLANVVVTVLLYSLMTGVATIGEEFGWRGVLQNGMIREFGFGKGVALLGFVWAMWHMPIILAGYNYPQTPVLGAFVLLPLLLMAASFVMAWLTLWSRSFWPAVFMHGGVNSVYDSLYTKVVLSEPSPYTMEFLEVGLFALLAVAAFFMARPMAQRLQAA